MSKPVVLAATYLQFQKWCDDQGISVHQAVYVSHAPTLRGRRAEDLVYLDGWEQRLDANALRIAAASL